MSSLAVEANKCAQCGKPKQELPPVKLHSHGLVHTRGKYLMIDKPETESKNLICMLSGNSHAVQNWYCVRDYLGRYISKNREFDGSHKQHE